MDIWRYFDGVVTMELTSADPVGAMMFIQSTGFRVWNLESQDPLTLRFQIRRCEWRKLCTLCEKRGEQVQVISNNGIYWTLSGLKERPVLVVGLMLLLLFSLWVPGRVFFVRVEGNATIASRQIVETAARCGITFGASRREVRSEKMKNSLLEAMPSLSWAGVNTYGCTAVITVTERVLSSPGPEMNQVCSIIAARDGIIRQMTVLRGNGICSVGQAVKAGQVLISGYMDCGLSIQAVVAHGEIFAETNRTLTAVCPQNFCKRGTQMGVKQKISLIIGKKRIIFSNSSGISCTGCAKIYEENYISLPGGFVLPVAFAVETCTFYETVTSKVDGTEGILTDFARNYLPLQMCSGKILQTDEVFTEFDDFLQLTGSYGCYEMIGITRIEENIPDYVKND